MRLLHVAGDPWSGDPLDISLCERIGANIPRYVILSHRWREEEVLFSDITNADQYTARSKKGWDKLESCCRIALQMGLNYVWNDTCCIDKASSAELSEAINSMYKFYAKSDICFTYLDDVDNYPTQESIGASIWFTRAWTLQELIAPKEVYLYSKGWKVLGTKKSLCDLLSEASHVPREVLMDPQCLNDFSIAEKMHWASWREATREEDELYSLMGIFDVHMPPLYGEGLTPAFRRLQIEIMQRSHDHTIFAWNRRMATGDMLATSPRDFLSKHTYRRMELDTYIDKFGLEEAKLDYTITNIGLHIELPIFAMPNSDNLFFAILACSSNQNAVFVAILLEKRTSGRFTRWFRSAWRDCTIYHFSSLDRFQYSPKELWISPRLRSDGSAYNKITPRSLLTTGHLPIHAIYPTNGCYIGTTMRSQGDTLQWSYDLVSSSSAHNTTSVGLLTRLESKVENIILRNTRLNIGVGLAFGTLNDKTWIFPRIWEKLPSTDCKQYLGKESAKLQRDCAFPHGAAWRHSKRNFLILDPQMDKTPWLFLVTTNDSPHWIRKVRGDSVTCTWTCQINRDPAQPALTVSIS